MALVYRDNLPQLSGKLFITDGGLETTMIYREGLELPSFAAFDLFKSEKGREALDRYFSRYVEIAKRYQTGFILDTATWRSNPDWGQALGYSADALEAVNRQAAQFAQALRDSQQTAETPIVLNGVIGPRGDGYQPDKRMSAEDAETYHEKQIGVFAESGVDMVSAITMNYEEEAVGIVWAARSAGVPVVISFTVETNGRLPTGQTLEEVITSVDEFTDQGPAYYMINCAHPTHFHDAVDANGRAAKRIRGVRANASKKSHAELDQATELDAGDPAEYGRACAALRSRWPQLNVFGGCCGTDERHIEEICKALNSSMASSPAAAGGGSTFS